MFVSSAAVACALFGQHEYTEVFQVFLQSEYARFMFSLDNMLEAVAFDNWLLALRTRCGYSKVGFVYMTRKCLNLTLLELFFCKSAV